MSEAVRCFNSGCYNAATIMIGLSAEKIVLDLIEAFKSYLKNNKTTLTTRSNFNYQGDLDISFISEVDNVLQISIKYTKFNEYFNGINNHEASVFGVLDKSARNTFLIIYA